MPEQGVLQGVGHQRDSKGVLVNVDKRETDTVQSDGAFRNEITQQVGRKLAGKYFILFYC
ncbi:MAG: hypothetical protein A3E37_04885 [Candidatus Andersenbacteria bacterium RIFCSPHIGHO2_12_FULL_46_9]|nr:MAG: hypothetical protein A3E37_04885 [Candidatus Andersenbacteria bacterium RIFCSPHIGHO2_12_FULL_46_9]